MRPRLDYCDVVYDKYRNKKFEDTLESIQYNVTLAVTGAIKGTSKEKFYHELGLEYLREWRWIRTLCLFHKIFHLKLPKYLYDLIPPVTHPYATKNIKKIPSFNCRMFCMDL